MKAKKTITTKLRKFIDKNKGIPLSDKEVVDLVDNKAKVVLYENLHKYDKIDQVFGNYDAIFLMYQQSPTWGHWVGLLRRQKDKEYEFFDPLGYSIDEQLLWTEPEMRKQLNEDYPYLTELLANAPDGWEIVENKTKFQKDAKNINSCGKHVFLRIITRNYPLSAYTKYFKSKNKNVNADDMVTILTMLKLEEDN